MRFSSIRASLGAGLAGPRFRVALKSGTLGANVAIGAAGGYVFWQLLNRHLEASGVGVVSTTIAIGTMLANIASLGLGQALIFARKRMPGRYAGAARAAMLVASLLALGAALLYLASAPLTTPGIAIYTGVEGALTVVALVLGLAAGGIQDATLFTQDRPGLIVARSLLTVTTRVGGALLLAPRLGPAGAVLGFALGSWAALAAGALWGGAEAAGGPLVDLPALRELLAYSASVYAVGLCTMATINLLPVIAVNTLGTSEAGYFYIAWMLANLLFIVPGATGAAVFIESSAADLRQQVRQGLRLALGGVALGGVAVAALAVVVLGSFGADYLRAALGPLLIMLASAVPMTFYVLGQSVLKTLDRVRPLIGVALAVALVTVGTAVVGARALGLLGIALAWLAGQCIGVLVWIYARPGAQPRDRQV